MKRSRIQRHGANRKKAKTPASAVGTGRILPTIISWRARAFRSIAASACIACKILPLKPWKRLGGQGTFIQLYGTEGLWGCYVVEVPGAGALQSGTSHVRGDLPGHRGPRHHEVWVDGAAKKHQFEWQTGSLFSIPMNAWHRVINARSTPARLLAATTAPNMINLVRNLDFIFNCPYVFKDRYSDAEDFFKPNMDIEPDPLRGLAMSRTNIIPDVFNSELPMDNRRSPGYRRMEPRMTENVFYQFIGQHENGRYSKAHAHASAAVLVCITGKGYTYTWPTKYGLTPWKDGHADQIIRQDYEHVGMVSAAPMSGDWFHTHFGVSKEPMRLLGWYGPEQPSRPATGKTGRKGHRRRRHRRARRRHGDPLRRGGSIYPGRVRSHSQERRRDLAHERESVRKEIVG